MPCSLPVFVGFLRNHSFLKWDLASNGRVDAASQHKMSLWAIVVLCWKIYMFWRALNAPGFILRRFSIVSDVWTLIKTFLFRLSVTWRVILNAENPEKTFMTVSRLPGRGIFLSRKRFFVWNYCKRFAQSARPGSEKAWLDFWMSLLQSGGLFGVMFGPFFDHWKHFGSAGGPFLMPRSGLGHQGCPKRRHPGNRFISWDRFGS